MRDPAGPFSNCHSYVSPDTFIMDCLYDTCAEFASREFLCSNMEQYALACQQNGSAVDGWRESTECTIPCTANSTYKDCMNACPASCSNMASESECEAPCNEGCQCDDGFIFSGFECVPYKDCGCSYLNIYYKAGDTFITDDCSQNCSCTEGSFLVCDSMECADGEECTTSNQIRGCYIPGPCLENPCQNGGTCEEVPGSNNSTSGMKCQCPNTHHGPYCEDEKQLNDKTIYIVIGVVLSFFVISLVLIVAAYFYFRSRKSKQMFDVSSASEDGSDSGSIHYAYREPGGHVNFAFNDNLGDSGVFTTKMRANANVNVESAEPGARVNLAFEDGHVNQTDDLTIF
ncbi:zonadhesin-like [Pseudophryne corroboree]|uniref:zonadhesin-like n=1 Tax=Pseudophryne corroboree TaxID=495146 RepID=UPI0030817593